MQTIELIKKWGRDRGITINGTHQGQWYKLVSEYGELADNLAKGKDVKDDIGDMFVVLVMMTELAELDIDKAMEIACPQTPTGAKAYDIMGALHINLGALRFGVSHSSAADLIGTLSAIADAEGSSLAECINIAYQDIKERKGYLTADGVFVRDVDAGCRIGGGV